MHDLDEYEYGDIIKYIQSHLSECIENSGFIIEYNLYLNVDTKMISRTYFGDQQFYINYFDVIRQMKTCQDYQILFKSIPPTFQEKKMILSYQKDNITTDLKMLNFVYNYCTFDIDFLPPPSTTEHKISQCISIAEHINKKQTIIPYLPIRSSGVIYGNWCVNNAVWVVHRKNIFDELSKLRPSLDIPLIWLREIKDEIYVLKDKNIIIPNIYNITKTHLYVTVMSKSYDLTTQNKYISLQKGYGNNKKSFLFRPIFFNESGFSYTHDSKIKEAPEDIIAKINGALDLVNDGVKKKTRTIVKTWDLKYYLYIYIDLQQFYTFIHLHDTFYYPHNQIGKSLEKTRENGSSINKIMGAISLGDYSWSYELSNTKLDEIPGEYSTSVFKVFDISQKQHENMVKDFLELLVRRYIEIMPKHLNAYYNACISNPSQKPYITNFVFNNSNPIGFKYYNKKIPSGLVRWIQNNNMGPCDRILTMQDFINFFVVWKYQVYTLKDSEPKLTIEYTKDAMLFACPPGFFPALVKTEKINKAHIFLKTTKSGKVKEIHTITQKNNENRICDLNETSCIRSTESLIHGVEIYKIGCGGSMLEALNVATTSNKKLGKIPLSFIHPSRYTANFYTESDYVLYYEHLFEINICIINFDVEHDLDFYKGFYSNSQNTVVIPTYVDKPYVVLIKRDLRNLDTIEDYKYELAYHDKKNKNYIFSYDLIILSLCDKFFSLETVPESLIQYYKFYPQEKTSEYQIIDIRGLKIFDVKVISKKYHIRKNIGLSTEKKIITFDNKFEHDDLICISNSDILSIRYLKDNKHVNNITDYDILLDSRSEELVYYIVGIWSTNEGYTMCKPHKITNDKYEKLKPGVRCTWVPRHFETEVLPDYFNKYRNLLEEDNVIDFNMINTQNSQWCLIRNINHLDFLKQDLQNNLF